MNLPKFNAKAGDLVKRSATFGREFMEFNYFSPKELPDMKSFCNDLALIELSNEANRAIGELHGLINNVGMVGSLKLFINPYLRKEEVDRLMNYLFDYVNTEEGYMRLIKAGLIHYYFETIHPYEDGNGRVGRTLILLYVIQTKILNEPILHLSPYFKRHKENYYNLLMNVRETGYYNRWIKFFLTGITEVAINISNKVRKLVKLYNEYRKKLVDKKATTISFKLLDKFFERPYYYITLLQEELEEDYPKTKRGLNYLLDCKIIVLYTRQKRNKIDRKSVV